jgi:hypothetical protein
MEKERRKEEAIQDRDKKLKKEEPIQHSTK